MAIKTDLGTLITINFDEMYYKDKEASTNVNSKTLQQEVLADNEDAPKALFSPFGKSTEEEEKKSRGLGESVIAVPKYKHGFKRLNPNAKYDRICIQMSNYRDRGRNTRASVYVSLKEDNENKFSVFLTGSCTDSKSELYRGCKNSQAVKDVIDALFSKYPDMIIGRLRYKSVSGYITDFHKKNTKSAIVGIYKNSNNEFVAILVLYYEMIEIPLTHPLSDKQQGWCVCQGIFNEYGEFDDEENL